MSDETIKFIVFFTFVLLIAGLFAYWRIAEYLEELRHEITRLRLSVEAQGKYMTLMERIRKDRAG